jgi:transposase
VAPVNTVAAVIVADLGEICRFARPRRLGCWAGLTPAHNESAKVIRRHVSKQGSPVLRWAQEMV